MDVHGCGIDAFILLGNFHHANQMSRVKVVERGVPQMSVPLAPPPKLHLAWALILGWSRVGAYFTNAPTLKAINGVKHQ